jgi:hypothetical protein
VSRADYIMTSLPVKSSDLLDIGAQCSLPGCLYVDFLPLRCACDQFFCREHICADEHQCTAASNRIPVTSTSGAASTEQSLQRCSLAGCEKPSMHAFAKKKADNTELEAQLSVVPVLCARCQQGYCARCDLYFIFPFTCPTNLSHRHAEDHSCTGPAPGPAMKNNEAGRAMLDKHFPDRMPSASASTKSTGGIRKRKLPADPKKRAQMLKVELMKTRHKAIPADKNDAGKSVLVDQRLHVSVNIGGSNAPAKYFWFRKVNRSCSHMWPSPTDSI